MGSKDSTQIVRLQVSYIRSSMSEPSLSIPSNAISQYISSACSSEDVMMSYVVKQERRQVWFHRPADR